MIKGLFIARQYEGKVWERDFESSDFWKTEEFDISIDVYDGFKEITKAVSAPKGAMKDIYIKKANKSFYMMRNYDFFLIEEIRLKKYRTMLDKLREKFPDKKIIFVSQEPFKPDSDVSKNRYFFQEKYKRGVDDFLFIPDAVLSPGMTSSGWWKQYTTSRSYLTGYPRFDYYCSGHSRGSRKSIMSRYGLHSKKKIIFFPSYPPYFYAEFGDGTGLIEKRRVGENIDLNNEREETIEMLTKFVNNNSEFQLVIKIHPMSYKLFKSNKFKECKEVCGNLFKYYNNPIDNVKVIADRTENGTISKELVSIADVVAGWGSTMLLEAMTIYKPVIHILVGKTKEMHFYKEYEDIFPVINNYNDLCYAIDNKKIIYDKMTIEKHFYKIDGKTCERMCRAIHSEVNNNIVPGEAAFKPGVIQKFLSERE